MALDLILGESGRSWGRGTPRVTGRPRHPDTSGSLLLPAKQQKAVFNKIDDVRYDLRRAGSHVRTGTLVLSASLGLLALASVYRTASGR